jgi:putative NADH-flavin reductase
MKLVVFGASGRIGTELVRQGVAAGHQVTAVVREGSTIQLPTPVGRVGAGEVVTADVMDPHAIASVVEGCDAVLSVLGPPGNGPSSVLTDGAQSVLRAMGETGVRRFLVVSVAGIHSKGDGPVTKYVVKPILQRILREPFADARRMEQIVRASELDWTIVCPPKLTTGAAKGTIRSNTDGTVRGGFTITRADVATYLLRAIDDTGVVRKTVVIAN